MDMTLLWGLIAGTVFGFSLHRAGFSRCAVVQNGLWIRDFTMFKVMLTAIVVGVIGVHVLAALAPEMAHFKIKSLHLGGVIVGGLVFGIGMVLGGYCPGTAIVGFGSGVGEGMMAVLGGLTGALAFIFAYPTLKPILIEPGNLGRVTLPSVLGLPPVLTALVLALLLSVAIWWLTKLEKAKHTTKEESR